MNETFQAVNKLIKPVWLRESAGLLSLLIIKFFGLCKELITIITHYHLLYYMSTFKNWKHQLQHHVYCLGKAVAFLMIVFTPDFPNVYFKACVVNGRAYLVQECMDSSARGTNLFGKCSLTLSLLGSGAIWGEGSCSCWDRPFSQSYTCVASVTEMAVTMPCLWSLHWLGSSHESKICLGLSGRAELCSHSSVRTTRHFTSLGLQF